MQAFKITLLSIFSIIGAYSLYATIGYLIWAIETPDLVGETTTHFAGLFLMSGIFFVVTILCTIFIFILVKKLKKK